MERELTLIEKNGITYQFTNDSSDLISDKYSYMWKVVDQKPKTYIKVQEYTALAKAGAFRDRLKCGYQTELNDQLDSTQQL